LRRQERACDNSSNKGFQPQRQANLHDVGNVVDFDDIIDYAVMNHDIDPTKNETSSKESAINDDTLLAYMSGLNGNNKSGDIRNVLTAKCSSIKGRTIKAIEGDFAPSSVQVGDTTWVRPLCSKVISILNI
jgi:hypothetical protein